MELDFTLVDEDSAEHRITGIKREDWTGLDDPCPVCGATEFNHYTTEGGQYGLRGSVSILRTDYWAAKKPLYTQCKNCRTTLYQHPAFDLLFGSDRDRGQEFEF